MDLSSQASIVSDLIHRYGEEDIGDPPFIKLACYCILVSIKDT